MKSPGSSDSLGALMSICSAAADQGQSPRNNNSHHVYGREFQFMLEGLEEEGCVEESGGCGGGGEKKRRLSVEQVKALEKNFEVENKLEPERKVKLAQELGLQPRQVAVWFQNRRARWKTKQLERDYGVLKANYDALKHNYDALQHDNDSLLKEVRELKAKPKEENGNSNISVNEELMASDSDNKTNDQSTNTPPVASPLAGSEAATDLNFEGFKGSGNAGTHPAASLLADFKDGSSDSDSSAILNEAVNSPNAAAISSSAAAAGSLIHGRRHHHQFLAPPSAIKFSCGGGSNSMNNCFPFLEEAQKACQPQFVKIEEHNFFSGDETCNFFSDEQAPTLQWYFPDPWN